MILLTGGSGRLGREIMRHTNGMFMGKEIHAPTHKEFDVRKPTQGDYDLVIHAAAYTNVARAEIERYECFQTNVVAVVAMTKMYQVPFVYISSEYAYMPTNFYAETKQGGEEVVKRHPNHLILRTLFKTRPFPYETAYHDQYTQGDYVDVIAPLVMDAIAQWSLKPEHFMSELRYVGTGRKTMLELARQTKPDVKPISVDDIKTVIVPRDYL